jgi:cystathionine beta-lyase
LKTRVREQLFSDPLFQIPDEEGYMTLSFDEKINRIGTHSIKWEFVLEDSNRLVANQKEPGGEKTQLLPMWIADMDFRSPPAVIEALVARAEHGVYGYSLPTGSFYEALQNWVARRHGWEVKTDWVLLTPGLLPALDMLVQTFVAPGEKVLIQPPVYYPFFWAAEDNGAEIVSNSLINENGRYRMDFDDLEQKASDPAVKMAILCNPHNPVGRVWTPGELTQFGEICLKNDVLVVSDEVHGDLIFSDYTFTSFARLGDDFRQKSVICMAASKTFNLAGLQTSSIVIPDDDLRDRFARTIKRNGVALANPFGIVATEAAYNHGEAWLAGVMAYIEDNYRFMKSYLAEHLPQLKISHQEGTYLVWVDFRELGMDPATRKQLIMEQARVNLDEGELFGPEGEGFERFNIACPRSTLEAVLDRIKTTITIAL